MTRLEARVVPALGDVLQTLVNPAASASDQFGRAVATDGNLVVVGAPFDDPGGVNGAGAAHVYDATTGALVRTLLNPDPDANDAFGAAVAISGSRAVVSARGDSNSVGVAYVFDAVSGALLQTLTNPDPDAGDTFGNAVAISGTRAVVAASLDDPNNLSVDGIPGVAYVCDVTTGLVAATLTNPNPAAEGRFGAAVALAGTLAVVSAVTFTSGVDPSLFVVSTGVVYAFDMTAGPAPAPLATLNNPNPAGQGPGTGDGFGLALALSGNRAVVGAPFEDASPALLNTGAAYVFDPTAGATPTPLRPLTNPDTTSERRVGGGFGAVVAIDGPRVLVATPGLQVGGPRGVGAVYVFDAATGALNGTLNNPAPTADDRFGVAVAVEGNVAVVGAPADDPGGVSDAGVAYVLDATPPPAGPGGTTARPLAVGGLTDGTAAVFAPTPATGQFATPPAATLAPFGNPGTNVRTAVADVDGDTVPDTVLVTGPGTPIRVAVVNGAENSTVPVAPFDPFGGDFRGGGYVAAGDHDGDGRAEFVVTPDQGGGPRVTAFSRNPDGSTTVRANFFGIDDLPFRGGARAAIGDVNNDTVPDVVVAAGFLGGPRTAVFTGQSVLAGALARLVNDFFAFPGSDAVTLRNGSFVAAGDVTGDGFADLIFGGGPGGAPRVFILSGALVSAGDVAGAQANPVANFFVAGNSRDRGGVRVAATNPDGDARADVAVGSGEGSPASVRVYLGASFSGGGKPGTFQDLPVFGGATLPGGVFVG